ncbi:MAG: nucleotidyltransferase domain-containing protein [Nitrospirales bacterium]
MERSSELEQIKEREIRPLLRQIRQIVRMHVPDETDRVLLFGSWATLGSQPTSDVDIGILGSKPVDELAMAKIREEIERLPTLRKIEVVDLNRVEARFRESVQRHAEILA